ncbi:MAG TPA: cytochrome c biogenesis protein CcsA [Opitutaceae bacterium]|nr:cytochrome c biogenesis protein CcsA [Opitutaceae bacterium]
MDFPSFADRDLIALGALCYALGFVHGTISLIRRRRHSRWLMFAAMCAGFAFQTWGLLMRGMETKGCPLGNTFELIQFTVWSLILVYLVVGPAFRLSLLGFFSGALAAALSIASFIPAGWDSDIRTRIFGDNAWIEFHAALALFSYGVFGLLALTSVMYLLQNHYLKQKRRPAMFGYLPSIVQLDTTNVRLLLTGVAILTTSLLVGGHYFRQDPERVNVLKLGVTVSVWAAYLGVLVLRWRAKLITKRFAWVCVIMFILALASLGPVNRSRPHELPPAPITR